jgi:hypothetical protein
MSVPSIGTPLERLSVLPDIINWKGGWVIGGQYYKNDVVVDPDGGSFILGITASAAGFDPSLDPAWIELSGIATGIKTLNEGPGITITNFPDDIINNEGILTVNPGTNINIDYTEPQNPKFIANVVTRLIGGNGIRVYGLPNPIVENTGVLSLEGVDGIQTLGTNDVLLTNGGILSLGQGPGTTITAGQKPTLSLINVTTVAADVAPSAIFLNGDLPYNPTVNIFCGQLSLMFDSTSTDLTTDPLPIPQAVPDPEAFGTGTLPITLADGIFTTMLANGNAQNLPDCCFLLDFSSWTIFVDGVGPTNGIGAFGYTLIELSFVDTTTAGGPFYYTGGVAQTGFGVVINRFSPTVMPYTVTLGQIPFNIADARSAGLRTINQIRFLNPIYAYLQILSAGGVWATFFPNGVQ